MMRVCVTGGRHYDSRSLVFDVLTAFHSRERIAVVMHGDSRDREGRLRGADRWADEWARQCGVRVESYPADWNRHGNAAGPMRNREMIDRGKPDLVIAFPGGSGTNGCRAYARRRRVPVVEVT